MFKELKNILIHQSGLSYFVTEKVDHKTKFYPVSEKLS